MKCLSCHIVRAAADVSQHQLHKRHDTAHMVGARMKTTSPTSRSEALTYLSGLKAATNMSC